MNKWGGCLVKNSVTTGNLLSVLKIGFDLYPFDNYFPRLKCQGHLYVRAHPISDLWTVNKCVEYPCWVYIHQLSLAPPPAPRLSSSLNLEVSVSQLFKWNNDTFLPQKGLLRMKQLVSCFKDELPCFHNFFASSLAHSLQLNICGKHVMFGFHLNHTPLENKILLEIFSHFSAFSLCGTWG